MAAGATRAESPKAVTMPSDVVVTMVPDAPDVEAFRSRPQRSSSRSPTPRWRASFGARSRAEADAHTQLVRRPIPAAFWQELKAEGLLPVAAPVL